MCAPLHTRLRVSRGDAEEKKGEAGSPFGRFVFRFVVDLDAHRASPETVENSPRATPCPRASAVAGRTKLPWRRRERQPDGSTAGGHPHFFGNPRVLRSAPQPAIRLHLIRDLVSRPFARPQREHAGLLARRHFARSRIRCSWRLGPVRIRQASSQTDDGDEHEGGRSKKFAMAPHCVRTLRARRSTPDDPTRNGEAPHLLRGCRRTTAEPCRCTITRLACNQIDEDPIFLMRKAPR
jgi:hypothetical protein